MEEADEELDDELDAIDGFNELMSFGTSFWHKRHDGLAFLVWDMGIRSKRIALWCASGIWVYTYLSDTPCC